MPNIRQILDDAVTEAMRTAYPQSHTSSLVAPSDATRFGDYQANGAMSLAKDVGENPHEVARKVAGLLNLPEIVTEPEVAGPGFINFKLDPEWVAKELGKVNADERLGVAPAADPETVVVDYSAPNLAKEMHVGHLRSTIIGDALVRMLDFAGHNVERQNHVGDWGTQFGMLCAYLDLVADQDAMWEANLGRVEDLYRRAKTWFDEHPEHQQTARMYVRRLQEGLLPNDGEDDDEFVHESMLRQVIRNHWEHLTRSTLYHCQQIYDRLSVTLTRSDVRGESAYNAVLPDIVRALEEKGLLTESEGARCVFLKDAAGKPLFANKDGDPLPLIVQKADEGYLYATTDLAAIAFRTGNLPEIRNPKSEIRNETSPKASRVLYVVDARQSLHFQMLFECAYQAGFADRQKHELVHVAFGTMMGADGKPFRTREGGTVKLMDLLDEAEQRARDLVEQKQADLPDDQPRLSDEEKQDIARKVGIGGVKYADLAQNRTSDYVFSWDKMLSLQGNTAPYMQYAYARVRSIFQKGYPDEAERGRVEADLRRDASPIPVDDPAEAALGKMLLRFPETLDRALADYRPNVLAAYLYDLAQAFTHFYDACPVLKSEEATRAHRLRLSDLTARVIAKGLDLLGIETAERM